jgi:hypothetical protein
MKTLISLLEKAQEREKGEEEKGQRAQAEEVGPCNQSRPYKEGTESKNGREGSGQCNRGGCWPCCRGRSGCGWYCGQGRVAFDEHDTTFQFQGSIFKSEIREV